MNASPLKCLMHAQNAMARLKLPAKVSTLVHVVRVSNSMQKKIEDDSSPQLLSKSVGQLLPKFSTPQASMQG